MGPRRITECLSIGNELDAVDYGSEFDRVVTMAPVELDVTTDLYLIRDGEHEYETFRQAVEVVIGAMRDGDDVLVHCQAGMSRSVSVASAALSVVSGEDIEDAIHRCKCGFTYPAMELQDSARRFVREWSGS